MQTLIAVTLALSLVLGGCVSSPGTQQERQPAATSLIPAERAFAGTRAFRADGAPAEPQDIVHAAASADVVVIAEQHGHPQGLSAAASLWREVLKRSARRTPALALEFFERDDQSRIDDYLAGLSTEEVFLKRTGKTLPPGGEAWAGGYPPGHRDMLEAAKAAGVPVYAANAPRAYVRLARTRGYAALANLTPEQQRLIVLPRFAADGARPDNRYWRDFLSFMGSTPEKYAASSAEEREKVDSMFRAQSIWDSTMADTVRKALTDGHAPAFLVVGQFHADYAADGGGGTVQALKAARPETKIVVVSFQDADPNGAFRAEDKGRADFIVYGGSHPSAAKQ